MNKTIDEGRRMALLKGLSTATGLVAAAALPGCGGAETAGDGQPDDSDARQRMAAVPAPSTLETYVVAASGVAIQRFGDVSSYVYTPPGNQNRLQAFAGLKSRGLLDEALLSQARVSTPLSIQFGTSQSNPDAQIDYWQANAQNMEGNASPVCVAVEAGTSHQYVGQTGSDKRVHWNHGNQRLTMMQLAGDHYVTGNPRVQLNGHPVPTKGWLRFYCHFQLGSAYVNWPAYQAQGLNSALIFQLKGDATAFPPLTLDVWNNEDGDPNLVDVVVTRRTVNAKPAEVVFRVKGLARRQPYRFVIDVFPNWENEQAHLSLWFNEQRVSVVNQPDRFVLTDATIYPIKDLYHPMWGIYRYRYDSSVPPVTDNAAIVWHRAEVQWKSGAPTDELPVPEI